MIPLLMEKDMAIIFISTLKAPFYERLVSTTINNFVDMVLFGEIIKSEMKSGKMSSGESLGSKKLALVKKKKK